MRFSHSRDSIVYRQTWSYVTHMQRDHKEGLKNSRRESRVASRVTTKRRFVAALSRPQWQRGRVASEPR